MFWRQLSQRICAMQDPNLRALGTDPVLISRLVMHQQIRLQGFNQIQDLRTPQLGMDCCAGEHKRPARADRKDVRIPALGVVRTPQVEHALSAAHGKIPRHEMDQSWTAVSWPKFCEMFFQPCYFVAPKQHCKVNANLSATVPMPILSHQAKPGKSLKQT